MKIQNMVALALFGYVLCSYVDAEYRDEDERFDIVQVGLYPTGAMEEVRNYTSSALYALEQSDYEGAIGLLQSTKDQLSQCKEEDNEQSIGDDNREFLQHMLDRINSIIVVLENSDQQSLLHDLYQQISENI